MSMYTVLGYWLDGTPVLVGIIHGGHSTICARTDSNDGPWATQVVADNPIAAGYAAIAEMIDAGPDSGNELDESDLLISALMSQVLESGDIVPDGKPHLVNDPLAQELLKMIFDKATQPDEEDAHDDT